MKDLQKEFIKHCKFIELSPGDITYLMEFIQDNYIPKDKVRGLKNTSISTELENENDYMEGYCNGIKEFNNSIDTLLK